MKKYLVIRSEKVAENIEDIYHYISFNLSNQKAAQDIYYAINKRIDSLEYYPQRFQLIQNEDLSTIGIRATHVGKYNIFYRIEEGHYVVHVLAVLYSGIDINQAAF